MNSFNFNDLLENSSDNFAIERIHYSKTVNMNNTHFHKHYEILYLQYGKRTIQINGLHSYELNQTNIALLRPNVIHQTLSNDASNQTRVLINISQELISQLSQLYSKNIISCFNTPILTLSHYDIGMLNYFFTELLDNKKTNPLYDEKIKINLAKILLHLSEIYFNTHNKDELFLSQATQERIEYVTTYIQEHFYNQFSLFELANKLHISETHLERIFKQAMGINPYKYLLNIRIVNAKRLLESNSMTISEIAIACGFNSLSSFSRAFKQIHGCSPKEYQKNHRNTIP